MKKRTLIIASVLAIGFALLLNHSEAKADPSSTMISHGQIVHDNKTPSNTSDDVILFDSDDLKTLETKLNALETRITAASTKFN